MRREEEIQRAIAAYRAAAENADRREGSQANGCSRAEGQPLGGKTASDVDSSDTWGSKVVPFASRSSAVHSGRTEKPSIQRRNSIGDYPQYELVQLIRWILSDGRLRTDDKILAEAARELGFRRLGKQIRATLQRAIAAARRAK